MDAEIEELVDSLVGANAVLISFANRKAEELDSQKQEIQKAIADLSDTEMPVHRLTEISGYLGDWGNTSNDDKRQVIDSLITIIRATNENVEIEWKI